MLHFFSCKKHHDYFIQLLGDEFVLSTDADLLEYGKDRSKIAQPKPFLIVFPKTVEQVREILTYCNKNTIAIVPSGGRTGLSGAAIAHKW